MPHKIQIKLKPWGREIWFAHTALYAGKILEIKKGRRYSLQYHEKKQETQFILSGKIKFTFAKISKAKAKNLKIKSIKFQQRILKTGDKFEIKPYTVHRAEALQNTKIFEISTPELEDVVKIEDDYGRKGRGNNEKLDKKLNKIYS